MNIGDIAERLIEAAEIENAAHRGRVGPKGAQSMSLPYLNDWADKNGWGAERHKEAEREFWQSITSRPSARQISEAEEAVRWLNLVASHEERHALAAWVRCMADAKRLHFQDWCKAQGIHRETGRRRKDRALVQISMHLSGRAAQDCTTTSLAVLHSGAETGHFADTVGGLADEDDGRRSWLADGAFTKVITNDENEFRWSQKRNERRRQRQTVNGKGQAA